MAEEIFGRGVVVKGIFVNTSQSGFLQMVPLVWFEAEQRRVAKKANIRIGDYYINRHVA